MAKKVDFGELGAYLAKTRGKRYPLQGHRLAGEEDYIKNLYLKHLAMTARVGKRVEEPQQLFLQRLAAGCEAQYPWEDYLRQGGEATSESLEELLAQLAQRDLKETFLLDAMLLLHLGSEDGERLDFLAELCAAMGMRMADVTYAARLCAGILTQDGEACLTVEHEPSRWMPYFPEKMPPALVDDGSIVRALAFQPAEVDSSELERLGEARPLVWEDHARDMEVNYEGAECIAFPRRDKVVFRNLTLPVDRHLLFSARAVEFEDCTFVGNGKGLEQAASLWFTKCYRITIRRCKFQNFGGRVMYATECGKILVEDSEFADCVVEYNYGESDWREFGAVVRDRSGDGSTALCLRRTHFINCGGRNERNYYVSSVLSDCKTSVFDCVFEGSRHWHGRSVPDSQREGSCCLFRRLTEESGNQLTDSAPLGLH